MTAAPPARRYEGAGSLAALYVVAVVVYVLLGHRQPVPLVSPDEFNYGHLARSLADGEGMTWRGEPVEIRAALYIYAITPAYAWWSLIGAYEAAKVLGALLVCLTVVPTWLVARPALGPRLALLPAALAVAGTWMTSTAGLLTENLAYPLATAALAATVAAVARPGSRWGWVALGFAALASWARLQCVALVPALALSLALPLLLDRRGARERLAADRAVLAVAWALSVLGVVLAFADPSILGSYAGVGQVRPAVGDLLSATGRQGIGLVAMAGLVPVLLVAAATATRRAWRDPALGPLLVVTWTCAPVLVVQSGWAITDFGSWHIERYVQYVLPILFAAATVAVHGGFVTWRRLGAATAVLALLLLLSPPVRQILEERAVYALFLRGDDLLGLGAAGALALTTLLVGAAATVAVRAGLRPVTAVLVVTALTGAVLLVQDQAGWRWQQRLANLWRADYPRDLSWIDHSGKAPVARLLGTYSSVHWPVNEFFNRDVTQVHAPNGARVLRVRGAVCDWTVGASGLVRLSGAPCDAAPRRFLLDDPYGRLTFYRQRVDVDEPNLGRVVSVAGAPRLRAALSTPCSRPAPDFEYGGRGGMTAHVVVCNPSIRAQLWLDAPGMLVLRFRGDALTHVVTIAGRSYEVAPGRVTAIRIRVPRGVSAVDAALDWRGPEPSLVGAELVQGAERTDLL